MEPLKPGSLVWLKTNILNPHNPIYVVDCVYPDGTVEIHLEEGDDKTRWLVKREELL